MKPIKRRGYLSIRASQNPFFGFGWLSFFKTKGINLEKSSKGSKM